MAQTIKLKRSATQNAVPSTSSLALGELAINTYDGKLFIKKNVSGTESIVTIGEVGAGSIGATELASSGVTAGSYGSTSAIPVITIDADGRITSASTATISGLSANSVTSTEIAANAVGISELDVSDGTSGQVLTTDGSGTLSFADQSGGSASATAFSTNIASGNGSTTAFTLSSTPSAESKIIAFINGVFQNQDAYTISGTTITFDTAPISGTNNVVVYVVGDVYSGESVLISNFSGDASTTAFTLSNNPGNENNTQVYIDGVYQQKTTYSVSGTTLTFSTAPPTGTNNIEVVMLTSTTVNTPAAGSVVTASLADNSVTGAKLVSSAVTTAKIADSNVTTAKIADSNVTTAKIADDAVTSAKLGSTLTLGGNTTFSGDIIKDSGTLTLDSPVDLTLDADSGNIFLKDGGTHFGTLQNNSSDFRIVSIVQDKDIIFRGNQGGSFVEAMRIDISAGYVGIGHNSPSSFSSGANNLVVNDTAGAGGITIVTPNDAKGSIFFADSTSATGQGRIRYNHDGDYMTFGTSGSEDKLVINSSGNVGIGTTSPNVTLTLSDGTDEFDFGVTTNQLLIKSVTSDGSDDQRIIIDAGNGGLSSTRGAYIALSGNEASTEPGHAIYQMGNVSGSSHVFRKAGGTDAVTIDSSGNVGINTSSPTSYANSQATLVIQDSTSPAIAWSDTGQTRDWFAVAQGSGLHFNYADGGGSGGASNVTSALVLDNSGKVGIGTDSPTADLTLISRAYNSSEAGNSSGIRFTDEGSGSADAILQSIRVGDDGAHLFMGANCYVATNGGSVQFDSTENSAYVDCNAYNGALIFGTSTAGSNPDERWRIDSSGHFTGATGSKIIQTIASSGGNFLEVTHSGNEAWSMAVQSGSGVADYLDIGINGSTRSVLIHETGGISFNGDTGSANHLDDYEEGTWTPACGATLATAVGKYTKIGNQVTVYYHLVTTGGLPTSTSQVIITGLPFTSNSGSLVAAPIYSRYYTPNDSSLTSLIQDSETQIRLMNINDQNFDYTIWGELEASSNNSVYIIGSATYMV